MTVKRVPCKGCHGHVLLERHGVVTGTTGLFRSVRYAHGKLINKASKLTANAARLVG